MRIGDHLSDNTKKKMHDKAKKKREIDPEELEAIRTREIEELMGVHRDRYERGRGGAVKRK